MLEKLRFLEEAIENAGNEVLEEMALLLEGGQRETIADSVKKIVKDLMGSAKNFESYVIEGKEEESFSSGIGFLSDPDDSKFGFKLGDRITVGSGGLVNPDIAYEQFDYPEELERQLNRRISGIVIARKKIEYFHSPLYVIQSSDGGKRLVLQSYMKFF